MRLGGCLPMISVGTTAADALSVTVAAIWVPMSCCAVRRALAEWRRVLRLDCKMAVAGETAAQAAEMERA